MNEQHPAEPTTTTDETSPYAYDTPTSNVGRTRVAIAGGIAAILVIGGLATAYAVDRVHPAPVTNVASHEQDPTSARLEGTNPAALDPSSVTDTTDVSPAPTTGGDPMNIPTEVTAPPAVHPTNPGDLIVPVPVVVHHGSHEDDQSEGSSSDDNAQSGGSDD